MGKFLIYLTTIMILLTLASRNIKNNRRIKNTLVNLVKEINQVYKYIFSEKRIIALITQGLMIVCGEILSFLLISTSIIRYLDTYFIGSIDIAFRIIAIIVSFIIVHYAVGYVLLISSKIHRFIYGVENKTLKVDFISSYFITSTFLTVLLIFPKEFNQCYLIGLIMVTICYYLNLKVLLSIMIKPTGVKSVKEDEASFSRVIIASVLLLIMLILNLYLAVCFVDGLEGQSYTNVNGYFDLFYYTIITFTTIGYGDITPLTVPAKIVAIIISITSVICLTVFLSSVFSYKDTLNE